MKFRIHGQSLGHQPGYQANCSTEDTYSSQLSDTCAVAPPCSSLQRPKVEGELDALDSEFKMHNASLSDIVTNECKFRGSNLERYRKYD